ncbi:Molybdopterin oxidoreductase subunit alpha [Pseudomonas caricapapayae]|uniref:Putative oxidoreductase, molybdopterin-binding subunit n=1 Tax=Pseudomonas caricapapayae TaxID=46678 RepID=A0A0P9JZ84_9PSED|nr:FdhF/YdeP family oxidoreductase [Pseudomonas caricapapayae]KAA8693867.1 FdhF/YdeP family oxidoreductase [Pseudomonas caricapapayae]KPW55025.1 Molybdopterin oxidoreductase subunit alpha [Pseudomonas caricapapayae]RMM05825.1 putative oxidoreductase, molybdopterin-binding subunit [Pseudomonas caricapapayae]RMV93345.1 putative oxidoreductase, molybdopterin-binding subunit [Pseudomonas caricapapayae]
MAESENSRAPLQGSQTDGSPAGGWPALGAVNKHLLRQHVLIEGNRTLLSMNKPGGFDCPSCSWPDPKKPHAFEYCENGAKALAWESTKKRVTPEFFARHTVSELATWSDHDLEEQGRITQPMRYDAASDKYLPVTWDQAFAEIGEELRHLSDPSKLELYTSGRTSNEAAFLYQLFGRLYGMTNFPDCSNMCHETTTMALPESIGVGKGTTTLEDFEKADAIFIIGQNPGSNSPRMMSELHAAARRGASIISFNPLRERALVRFAAPQDPRDMLSLHGVKISSQYHQVRIGGDLIALQGICKAVIEADDVAQHANLPRILDVTFIDEHTHGFEQYAAYCRQLSWDIIERHSGLTRQAIEDVAAVYMRSEGVICCWGMGVTQHKRGGDAVQQIINLLLLRGNIGKPGAGACPVRGHSNVQGDRTMGIYEKAGEPFLASMSKVFGFEASRKKGHAVAETCEALLRGEVEALISMGGNFFRAIPDTDVICPTVSRLKMTVLVNTKLNRSATVHGQKAFLLPCVARSELDMQNGVAQTITVEDSMSMVHGSTGMLEPASNHLISEIAIIAGMAKATLEPNPKVNWDGYVGDYARIRDKIEEVLPEQFYDFNQRILEPGGFRLPNAASERKWDTESGKANFLFPEGIYDEDDTPPGAEHLQLMTIRSHDQFNTTVYSNDDRYRDIYGDRMVVMLNPQDIERLGLKAGDYIEFQTALDPTTARRAAGFKVVPYDVPQGCCAAYYPETNGLLPLANRDKHGNTPAAKSIPVNLVRMTPEGAQVALERRGLIAAAS